MNGIRVGLIGYGHAGAIFHAPLIAAEPRLRLAAVVTSRTEQLAAAFPNVRAVASVEEMLGDPAIELVVVASPNTSHVPFARAALLAGKHVVVDKPFTPTLTEADALVMLAEERGRLLSVFHNRRWDDGFLTVQQLLERNALGRLAHYEAHFDRFRPAIKQGWREEERRGSGLLYDLGPHLVDQSLVLFGLPRAVTADIARQRPDARVDDCFHLVLDYGNLRAVLHAANLVYRPGPAFTLHGDGGSFVKHGLDPQEAALKEGRRPGQPGWGVAAAEPGILWLADGSERVVETVPGRYEAYYAGIAASLRDSAPPPVTAHEARNVMLVLDAAIRSAAERRTVAVI
ncbi:MULTISPECIES: oxidoreductase [Azospirillum]|uniref:Oxidoreductase n=1 Tax=Azospirillum brasilense TaxID=192 RepID=A0ABU4PL28_AZOBR|nr:MULTISPECIES: oxidoreductase [Azospirillum]ALJ39394.1 oxidoreductase [Azospirillum brasilense]MDX5955997.1 oxidoreductase [Azospirillum brasilense]PWC88197.1 oxidoreductase [Azospirillum sp. Sp 7]